MHPGAVYAPVIRIAEFSAIIRFYKFLYKLHDTFYFFSATFLSIGNEPEVILPQ